MTFFKKCAAVLALLLIAAMAVSCDASVQILTPSVTAPNLYGETPPPAENETAEGEVPGGSDGSGDGEPAAQPEKQLPPDARVSFLACGDNIIHSNVYEDALDRGGGTSYEFIHMYDDVADIIASADLAYINQEGPMGGEKYGYSGYPNFNGPQEMGDALVDLGFNIVNIANNHMLDKWESGFLDTAAYWKTKDATLIGAYLNKADYDDIRVVEKNGIKIALLSYTYGTNGMVLNKGSETVIPLIVEEDIRRQCALAREKAEFVICSVHWGNEDWFKPSDHQIDFKNVMVECGVDVIVGTHPHVLQPIVWEQNAEGHKTLVIYSLGNFISTMLYSRNMVGGMITFDIVRKNGVITVENPLLHPTVCYYNRSRRGLQVYKMENFPAELAASHGSQKYGAFDLDTLKKYVTGTIDSAFLPDYLKS
jgi:poly-gamma-glutamate synthesis protein (capsule biosynthesis protein)